MWGRPHASSVALSMMWLLWLQEQLLAVSVLHHPLQLQPCCFTYLIAAILVRHLWQAVFMRLLFMITSR
ncbi:hypothetical protein L211DRAFT_553455 [Terfezia boudieri ATCC MYA-4762]|uniref:Secreted protein n=1 Tax=Terfezia boudieri ATCC MYA-4762 TaxID=1051890 RepID=A0A3N4MEJ4_9PEZI|nr:hypothetical protein L211DRAFT_553455 [Terfezia boudieri ATCC MYA-4762]